MRICKTCGEKFSLKQNLKSIYKRDGRIECQKCNSVFILKKENIFIWIFDLIFLYILISISSKVGGFKGIVLSLVIGFMGVLISLSFDSRYILKSKK